MQRIQVANAVTNAVTNVETNAGSKCRRQINGAQRHAPRLIDEWPPQTFTVWRELSHQSDAVRII